MSHEQPTRVFNQLSVFNYSHPPFFLIPLINRPPLVDFSVSSAWAQNQEASITRMSSDCPRPVSWCAGLCVGWRTYLGKGRGKGVWIKKSGVKITRRECQVQLVSNTSLVQPNPWQPYEITLRENIQLSHYFQTPVGKGWPSPRVLNIIPSNS